MSLRDVQARLNTHGFPCGAVDGELGPRTKAAVSYFQIAYCGPGGWLVVDGVPGPRTQEALGFLPRLSTHFVVDELRSKGNGNCYVRRELLSALEELRARTGRPLPLRSAYRDPDHNRRVGGAKDSMHVHGFGCDPADPQLIVADAVAARRFSGIGDKGGVVRHLDVRHLAGSLNRTPGATPERPARWPY